MKIGKWSDRSLIMSPLSHKAETAEILLVKMLSIRVALYEVSRVGLEISGEENEKIRH